MGVLFNPCGEFLQKNRMLHSLPFDFSRRILTTPSPFHCPPQRRAGQLPGHSVGIQTAAGIGSEYPQTEAARELSSPRAVPSRSALALIVEQFALVLVKAVSADPGKLHALGVG